MTRLNWLHIWSKKQDLRITPVITITIVQVIDMKHVTESTAYKQAKEIFNNSNQQIIDHFKEESDEFLAEIERKPRKENQLLDEAGDLAYMFNQVLIQICGTDYLTVLKKATIKNEKKRK